MATEKQQPSPADRRKRYLNRLEALKNERSSWDSHWRELSQYIQPRRSRFFAADSNRGEKRNQSIINSAATRAARILSSGMMAGITSPARPWFRLTLPDDDLAESGNVKAWLAMVEERILGAFGKSNLYNVLHSVYGDLAVFGTAAFLLEEDEETVLRAYAQPVGEYYLATNARGEADTIYREMRLTVGQCMEKFGRDACSARIQSLYDEGKVDEWVDVVRIVEPRRDGSGGYGPKSMKWASCWFEKAGDTSAGFLRESGYTESPLLAPRWDVLGEDVYGSSPGMEALGDVKALQKYEKDKAQAVSRIVDPPMAGPSSLENRRASLLPGSITYLDTVSGGQRFEPVVMVPPAVVQVASQSIGEHAQRVEAAFYADLWLMMSEEGDPQKTAREISERHEEKMLQLGPVMERLEAELLRPMVDRAFGILLRAGQLPPPPKEMQGQDVRVEFLSVMAQAQKMIKGQSIQQLAGFVGNVFTFQPNVVDKVNLDEMVAQFADSLGLPGSVLVPEEQVQAIRQQREQAAAQQQQAEAAAQAAQGAKTLSETDTSSDNGLTRILGGVAAAQAGGGGIQ